MRFLRFCQLCRFCRFARGIIFGALMGVSFLFVGCASHDAYLADRSAPAQTSAQGSAQTSAQNASQNQLPRTLVQIRLKNGSVLEFRTEVAVSHADREKGLMNRKKMPSNAAMLFVFDKLEPQNFWMKNTLIPLDMFFADEQYRIIHIEKNAQPCRADPCLVYASVKPAQYVLEVNGGLADMFSIGVGDQLAITN